MGVQHQWAAQRNLTAPPTSYAVVWPSSDPWLAAAGLAPRDVIPGVVVYEWDSPIPGCFAGQVVPLMAALLSGSDGDAGLSKSEVHRLTGMARTTIDRIAGTLPAMEQDPR